LSAVQASVYAGLLTAAASVEQIASLSSAVGTTLTSLSMVASGTCQGYTVMKYDYYYSYSAAHCLELCSQSASCGATTFENGYSTYCARDTARPTCSPHPPRRTAARASGRH